MAVRGIPSEEIGGMWATLAPLIQKALRYSDKQHNLEDIRRDLLSGAKQVIFSPNPVCLLISNLITYPDGRKSCNVFMTAGTLPNDWRQILAGLEQWAREKGCRSIEMTTIRKGWSRRLPDWQPIWTRYRKELLP